ncbi:MAG: lysine exporter LysO family protein [Thiopseudomonas sp.]|nr:lysine exporter LysO family protein [Thiopseudomonas sp.]MCK9464421.1 lysine exporter LysO family protein [Thiopseudomonas sp.]
MLAPLTKILTTVLPILLYLLAGYLLGKRLTKPVIGSLVKAITPVVWVILFVIGMESGEAFSSFASGISVLKQAAVYAFTISVVVFLLLLPFNRKNQTEAEDTSAWQALWYPVKECLIAFSLVLLGAFFYRLHWHEHAVGEVLFNISYWLYVLLFFIGLDLAQVAINRSWLAPHVLVIPAVVMLGSMLAGVLLSWMTGERLMVSLALSTGFGWFSLSGALAGQHLGEAYGSIALLNDLMRELIGLTVVFILGRNYSNSSIGVCGATAMDTTLPFVRKACNYEYVPTAIISGLILTVAAPFFMLFFLSFVTV